MTTLAAIVEGLRSTLATNSDAIDQSSTDEYLPPITTANTALIIPAFGQESEYGSTSFAAGADYQVHRFRVELWVKHTGNNADLTQRARAVLAECVRILWDNPTLGDTVETIGAYESGGQFDVRMDASIADGLVEIGGVSYLICTINVPVTDFSLP